MAIWTFPLKSINGSNMYSDKDFRRFYANIFSSGIIPNVDLEGNLSLQVLQTEIPSMSIRVGPGVDMINGGHIMNTNFKSFSVPAPLTTQKRIDCIVVQWNESTNSGDIIYKKNTTQVIRSQNIWEHKLAEIVVPANATSISQANIKDTRAELEVCGYSSPFKQINVGDLAAQFRALTDSYSVEFQEWFQNLKDQLDDNQAGNLQNQIDNSIHDGGQVPKGTDLDLFINPGFYAASGRIPNTELINYPEGIKLSAGGAIYAQIVVFKNTSSTMVKQVFYDQQSTDEYTRSYANNTWQAWQKVKTDKDDTPWEDIETMNGFKSGSSPLQYRIYNGNVYLRGRINTVTSKALKDVQFGKIPVNIEQQHEWLGLVIGTTTQVRLMLSKTGVLTLSPSADMGKNFQISGFDTNCLID